MFHKALKSVRRKRKDFRKCKDINHPAVKLACRVARVELRKSRCNFEEKLALNIKNDSKSFLHTLVAEQKIRYTLALYMVTLET